MISLIVIHTCALRSDIKECHGIILTHHVINQTDSCDEHTEFCFGPIATLRHTCAFPANIKVLFVLALEKSPTIKTVLVIETHFHVQASTFPVRQHQAFIKNNNH